MNLTDFLRYASEEMDKFEMELPSKGKEYCKMYLNSAGRDLMLSEMHEGWSKENRQRYQLLRERLQGLRDFPSSL
jgi:hypothetical protein